ncbi:MAG: hypothetical protein PF636_07150 [Actinomycetota bacterium]|jgi:hypothetical protein|nr:hypothetical protein [Actinomycetota bacterium]
MKRFIAVIVVLSVILGAYTLFGRTWLQERSVRQAIVEYDLALTDAFLSGDVAELADVATDAQRASVSSYLGLFELQGMRLEAELVTLDLISFEITPRGATAEVQELWTYDRLGPDGLSAGDRTVEASTLRYMLVDVSGDLIVDDVTVLRTESREEVNP